MVGAWASMLNDASRETIISRKDFIVNRFFFLLY